MDRASTVARAPSKLGKLGSPAESLFRTRTIVPLVEIRGSLVLSLDTHTTLAETVGLLLPLIDPPLQPILRPTKISAVRVLPSTLTEVVGSIRFSLGNRAFRGVPVLPRPYLITTFAAIQS